MYIDCYVPIFDNICAWHINVKINILHIYVCHYKYYMQNSALLS